MCCAFADQNPEKLCTPSLFSPCSTSPTLIPFPYCNPLLSLLRSSFPLPHHFPVLPSPVCPPSSQSPPAALRFPILQCPAPSSPACHSRFSPCPNFNAPPPTFASWVWGDVCVESGTQGCPWLPFSRFSSSAPAPGNHPHSRRKPWTPSSRGEVQRGPWPVTIETRSGLCLGRPLPKHFMAPSQGALRPFLQDSDCEGLHGHLEPLPGYLRGSRSHLGSCPLLL